MNPPASNRPYYTGMLCVAVTSLGWGLNWPAMKYLIQECPPLFARGAAGLAAALGFYVLARLTHERRTAHDTPARTVMLGAFFNVFAWMGFATLSLRWLTAGQGALIVYTMPIWTALWAWALRGARPTLQALAGLGLSILGLAVLFGGGDTGGPPLVGVVAALAAAVLFGLSSVILKPPRDIPPFTLLAWQLAAGSLPMLLIDLWIARPSLAAISPLGWSLLAYMAVFPMGVCYLAWFGALRRLPATTASAGTMLTPLIGAYAGAVSLGEPFGARELVAVVLTIGGVLLVMGRRSGAIAS
ncbi:MAG TPA: DMT family transporter [Noviherbaspirillum sp.]|jgi:drug/metabolite transporter (DMT)-like permease|uniref:DMT family transporter n=1 Tax=Noviherbaspirillum sp. TaxID=1926288 RepID=UPI002F93A95F